MIQAVRSSSPSVQQRSLSPSAPLLLTNARLPGYGGLKRLWVSSNGIVEAVEPMDCAFERLPEAGLRVINLERDWLSVGGVDLQINGALGLAFNELAVAPESAAEAESGEPSELGEAHRLGEICQYLWEAGIDAFLPTLVTSAVDQVQRALAVIASYCQRPSEEQRAKILGVHLEGPCLAPAKRGAHPEAHLQPLTPEAMAQVLGSFSGLVKLVTLAPELDPSGAAIAQLREQGIAVSLGHSQATAAQAQRAFAQGASLVTHAFNAMPGLHHREPGLLGAALVTPGVRCGVIADGQHISPLMLQLLWRMGGREQLFLVSDALAPLGLPDGTYPWDQRQIEVQDGTARLADGTLSGTTRSLLTGVQNLVKWEVCSVEEAILLATEAPRQAIGDISAKSSPRQHRYVGQAVTHLLRWTWDSEGRSLDWQRFSPALAGATP